MSKQIPLTRGKVAIVDSSDFQWLNQWKWACSSSGYAVRTKYLGADPNKKGKYLNEAIYMHCLISDSPKNMDTDHRDGNTLNNQRSNLRICTHKDNGANQKLRKNNKSGFKGVYWYKARKKWQAYINTNYKRIHLGYFLTRLEAAQAYNLAATKHFGEYAMLNKLNNKEII